MSWVNRSNFILITTIILPLITFSPPAFAVMLPISTEHLVRQSNVVIRGEVDGMISKWATDRSAIVTQVSVSVHDILRGKLDKHMITAKEIIPGEYAKDVVTIEYDGGIVDDMEFGVSDSPTFIKKEEVILFLKIGRSRVRGNVYKLVGSAQGKYTIDEAGLVKKDGFAVIFEKEEDNALIDNLIPVEDLIKKINPNGEAFIHLNRSRDRGQR